MPEESRAWSFWHILLGPRQCAQVCAKVFDAEGQDGADAFAPVQYAGDESLMWRLPSFDGGEDDPDDEEDDDGDMDLLEQVARRTTRRSHWFKNLTIGKSNSTKSSPETSPKKRASLNASQMARTSLESAGSDSVDVSSPSSPARMSKVIVERVYDLYEPTTQNITVVEMAGAVLHRRLSGVENSFLDNLSSGSETEEQFCQTPELSPKVPAGRNLQDFDILESVAEGDQEEQRLARRDRRKRKNTVKTVTNWGVIVGKALHAEKGKNPSCSWDAHPSQFPPRRRKLALLTVTRELVNARKLQNATERSCQAVTRYRGSVMNPGGTQLGTVQQQAKRIITQATILSRRTAREQRDQYDNKWKLDGLLVFLFGTEYEDTLLNLATTTRRLVAQQSMLVEAEAPCRVIGDLFGQLRDLLLLFHAFGRPGDKDNVSFVFNGNYINHGCHQLEVLGLLFALKVHLPEKVCLLRGNHEERYMNEQHGFMEECQRCLGKEKGRLIYEQIHMVFDQLPFACLVEKEVLVVHGGIGDGRWDLSDLRDVRRPLGTQELHRPDRTWLANILWSNPIEDDHPKAIQNPNEAIGFRRTSQPDTLVPLDCQVKFGWDVTKTFCAQNGLNLIIRSHQCKTAGFGFEVMHDDMLMRVFSARDFQDNGNDASALLISHDGETGKPRQLRVRPQVLRSVTKSRAEARSRKSPCSRQTFSRQTTPGSSTSFSRQTSPASSMKS